MSRLTRDGTAEPISRGQIFRRERGQRNINFPCSANHEQDWQPHPVDPYSRYMCDHTYIRAARLLHFVLFPCSADHERNRPPCKPPQTVRPTEHSPRAQNPDAKSRGTRDNAVRLRHVEPARVPLRHAAPSPPQVLDSLHRLAKAKSRRPPDFLSGHTYYEDGK